jgi:hypothetical protein
MTTFADKAFLYFCISDEKKNTLESGYKQTSDLLYLAIICSSIVNFFQNFVQYWYTSN